MEIPVEENLVVKAFRLLEKQCDLPPVKIHLHKVIPTGAGLGGGSSDAAFLLKMVNELFQTGFSKEQLEEMAGTLGADCPFFIGNTPAMATGTGNILYPIPVDLSCVSPCPGKTIPLREYRDGLPDDHTPLTRYSCF